MCLASKMRKQLEVKGTVMGECGLHFSVQSNIRWPEGQVLGAGRAEDTW